MYHGRAAEGKMLMNTGLSAVPDYQPKEILRLLWGRGFLFYNGLVTRKRISGF